MCGSAPDPLAQEREAWLDAVTHDPLLPGRILPLDYLGQQAWRVEVLRDAGRQLRTFNPEKPAQAARDERQVCVACATWSWSAREAHLQSQRDCIRKASR